MLQPWKWASNYMGADWTGWYTFLSRTRDSECLENSNFEAALAELGGETEDAVEVAHESHWACGWIEWIAIRETAIPKLAIAREIAERLESYPVLDDDDLSRREWECCADVWSGRYDDAERIEYLRNHPYTAPDMPTLMAACRGRWEAAANILHCPSDLAMR